MCDVIQEKAIAIRITRIAYAFRNGVWPKPMEGLDLFNPTISDESSDESSMSEIESETGGRSDSDFEGATTRSKRKGVSVVGRGGRRVGDVEVDTQVEVRGGRRDFEIEKVKIVLTAHYIYSV